MKQIIKIIFTVGLFISFINVTLSADESKGQRLYLKKLKSVCHMNGAEMATKHSSEEWKELHDTNKLADEIRKICPKVKDSALKDKFMLHYYDFFKMYSSDSGNIPSC